MSEQKIGYWEKVQEQPYFRKHFHTICCSECKKKSYERTPFCPYCGAKMEDKKEK